MPDRHFLRSDIFTFAIVYSFYFLLVGSRRNECNSLWENKGERSEVYCLLGRYLCHGILFTCSHITFPMVYSFYFLCFGFGRKECNKSKGDYFNFLENDNPLSLYCSLKEVNNLLDDISFEQVAAF